MQIKLTDTNLPDSDVCSRVSKGPFEHMTHLEGIGVNLCDVVQHHQDGSQRVDAGEQADVAEEQKELQVVVKCSLREVDLRVQILLE